MNITRSSKCSIRFATQKKRDLLQRILQEYGRIVNIFIDRWWLSGCPKKSDLVADLVSVKSWLSARMIKQAAREAIDMINAVRERILTAKKNKERCKTTPRKPVHRGHRMCVCADIVLYQSSKTTEFDAWLHLQSIGGKIIFDIPIKHHKHFNELSAIGKRNNYYIITKDYVQFSFDITVKPKLEPTGCVAVDSGINCLASLSTQEQFGDKIKDKLLRIKRCEHGSKGQQRARRALKQYIDITAKQVYTYEGLTLLVTEQLKNITKDTKKRNVGRDTRYLLGSWCVRYWLKRLEMGCERNRISFRTVPAYNTSRTCPSCGHCHKGNRNGTEFRCLQCGYNGNADIIASDTILNRFLTSKYGKDCTRLPSKSSGTRFHQSSQGLFSQQDNTTFQLMNGQGWESAKTIPEFTVPVSNDVLCDVNRCP